MASQTHDPSARCGAPRSPLAWAAAVALIVVASAGCTSSRIGAGTYVAKWQPAWKESIEATYRFGLPGQGWELLQEEGTQVAWRHSTDPAVIQIYSECGGHGDSDLGDFTDHQRIDYSSWQIVEEPTGETDAEGRAQVRDRQYFTTIADREALRTTVVANLDGAEIMIEYVVVKKNGCLFDLTYIAVPRSFDAHTAEFQQVIDGFRFPIRR